MIDIYLNKEKTKQILEEKAELLKAISHPVRLCILTLLIQEEQSNVGDIQCCLDVPQPTVSQHLAKLKSSDILSSERNGTEIIYKIKNDQVKEIMKLILQ